MVTKLLCIEIGVPVSRYVPYFWYTTVMYRKYWWYVSKYFDTPIVLIHRCSCIEKMIHIAICIKTCTIFFVHDTICIKKMLHEIIHGWMEKIYEFWYTSPRVLEYCYTWASCIKIFGTYSLFLIHIEIFFGMYRNMYHFFCTRFSYTHILIHELGKRKS